MSPFFNDFKFGPLFVWPLESSQLPSEFALIGIGEVIAVFDGERVVAFALNGDRRPQFFDRVKTCFALAVRADDAVRALIAGAIDSAVGPFDAFVEQDPEKRASQ